MNRFALRKGFFSAILFLILFVVACGGPNVKGTYSNANGLVTLELRSGGEASITMMGESKTCSYKVDNKQVVLACGPDSLAFHMNEDGSLNGPGFMGILTKSKS